MIEKITILKAPEKQVEIEIKDERLIEKVDNVYVCNEAAFKTFLNKPKNSLELIDIVREFSKAELINDIIKILEHNSFHNNIDGKQYIEHVAIQEIKDRYGINSDVNEEQGN